MNRNGRYEKEANGTRAEKQKFRLIHFQNRPFLAFLLTHFCDFIYYFLYLKFLVIT